MDGAFPVEKHLWITDHFATVGKTLGSYSVPLKLHPEITAQLKVDVVAASPEEKDKP